MHLISGRDALKLRAVCSARSVYTGGEEMKEYYKFILKNEISNVDVPWAGEKEFNNIEFMKNCFETIEDLKRALKIKEEDYKDERLLLSVIDKFANQKIVFFKKKPDEKLSAMYAYTKGLIKGEKANWKSNGTVNYDKIFDVMTNILILMSNSMISSNKLNAEYSLADIKIEAIVNSLDLARRQIIEKECVDKRFFGFLGKRKRNSSTKDLKNDENSAKIFIEVLGNTKPEKQRYYLKIFCDAAIATYVRNEELKGEFGNVW